MRLVLSLGYLTLVLLALVGSWGVFLSLPAREMSILAVFCFTLSFFLFLFRPTPFSPKVLWQSLLGGTLALFFSLFLLISRTPQEGVFFFLLPFLVFFFFYFKNHPKALSPFFLFQGALLFFFLLPFYLGATYLLHQWIQQIALHKNASLLSLYLLVSSSFFLLGAFVAFFFSWEAPWTF